MKKLGTVIQYECVTSLKPIWVFYAILFTVVLAVSVLVRIAAGSSASGVNCLEINSMVYAGILGVLGFKDDFKMLLQNGFTRKYIFLSTISLFAFVSGIMSFVDTIVGNTLYRLVDNYNSLFNGLYGDGHMFLINWFWLFFVYMLICCLLYFIILIMNKIGKTAFIFVGAAFGLIVTIALPALFRFVLPKDFTKSFFQFFIKGAGFMANGSINFAYPILFLLLFTGILSCCSYFVIRRTELRV